jgi:hypothetical protein
LGGFNETAESFATLQKPLQKLVSALNSFKKFSNIIFPEKGSLQHKTMFLKKFGFHGLIETVEADSAV